MEAQKGDLVGQVGPVGAHLLPPADVLEPTGGLPVGASGPKWGRAVGKWSKWAWWDALPQWEHVCKWAQVGLGGPRAGLQVGPVGCRHASDFEHVRSRWDGRWDASGTSGTSGTRSGKFAVGTVRNYTAYTAYTAQP